MSTDLRFDSGNIQYSHRFCLAATSPQPLPATEPAKNGGGPDSTQVDLSKVNAQVLSLLLNVSSLHSVPCLSGFLL